DEPVTVGAAVSAREVIPDNRARGADTLRNGAVGGERIVDGRIAPVIQKAMLEVVGIDIIPNDAAGIVDRIWRAPLDRRRIQEAVDAAGVGVGPDDLPRKTDAVYICAIRGKGIIDGGEGIHGHKCASGLSGRELASSSTRAFVSYSNQIKSSTHSESP